MQLVPLVTRLVPHVVVDLLPFRRVVAGAESVVTGATFSGNQATADGFDDLLADWPTWLAQITPTVFARTPLQQLLGLLAVMLAQPVGIGGAIAAADGLLLSTPEYNNSIPGVFKNAIDWLSRPMADIPQVFGNRPVALIVGRTDDPLVEITLTTIAAASATRMAAFASIRKMPNPRTEGSKM